MKRLHLHFKSDNLDQSIKYYSALFGAEPTRREPGYVKWLLDDPSVNFSISETEGTTGFDHAGISLETREELDAAAGRLRDIGEPLFAQEETTCCYAKSNKYWARDPHNATWELFQTFADSETFGAAPEIELAPAANVQG